MKIHFIGIGGIGVSALAKYYRSKGAEVTGSDLTSSEITDFFKEKGVKIQIGKDTSEMIDKTVDKIIYTSAVPENAPEIKKARKLNIPILTYPQALGQLTKEYFTIAVAGTHGKSTTSAMASIVLEKAGLDPTVIIGTKVREFENSNERTGDSKYLIIEACEHFGSFLNYEPNIVVLTNIERDHLEYYENLENLKKGFRKFIDKLPEDGLLIANKDDENVKDIISKKDNVKWFSLKDKEKDKIKNNLQVPGEFNVANALSVLKLARELEIKDKITLKALSEFKGTWRRFETFSISKPKEYTLISDYGHHSTALIKTLKAAREKYPDKKILCFFQPHQYQRTYYLFDSFVEALREAPVDKIFIDNIYEAQGRQDEKFKKKVNTQKLVKKVNKDSVSYLPQDKIEDYLNKNVEKDNVVILMGAGNIYNNVAAKIINKNIKKS